MGRLDEDMMPETDKVAFVGKCHHALRVFLGYREAKLEHVANPLAEVRRELAEDEVWVCFGYGRLLGVGKIMAKGNVV